LSRCFRPCIVSTGPGFAILLSEIGVLLEIRLRTCVGKKFYNLDCWKGLTPESVVRVDLQVARAYSDTDHQVSMWRSVSVELQNRAHPLSQSAAHRLHPHFKHVSRLSFRLLTSHGIASVMIGNFFIGNGASAQDSF
jgi:hypothetical protein